MGRYAIAPRFPSPTRGSERHGSYRFPAAMGRRRSRSVERPDSGARGLTLPLAVTAQRHKRSDVPAGARDAHPDRPVDPGIWSNRLAPKVRTKAGPPILRNRAPLNFDVRSTARASRRSACRSPASSPIRPGCRGPCRIGNGPAATAKTAVVATCWRSRITGAGRSIPRPAPRYAADGADRRTPSSTCSANCAKLSMNCPTSFAAVAS